MDGEAEKRFDYFDRIMIICTLFNLIVIIQIVIDPSVMLMKVL